MNSTKTYARRQLQALLLATDALCLTFAFFIAQSIRFQAISFEFLFTPTWAAFVAVTLFFNYIMNLYEPRGWKARIYSIPRSVVATAMSLVVLILGLYLLDLNTRGLIGRGILISGFSLYLIFSVSFRAGIEASISKQKKTRWLVLLQNKTYENLKPEFETAKQLINIYFVELMPNSDGQFVASKNDVLTSESFDGVIVENRVSADLMRTLMELKLKGTEVLTIANFFEVFFQKIPVYYINRAWFAFGSGFSIIQNGFNKKMKRVADILIASIMLTILSPLLLITILLVKLESRGAALYSQKRVGENGWEFTMWKFRSMRADAETSGVQWAQKNDTRVTRFGRFMRLTRLDELPQLFNVLIGDMSFIGPRPERPEFTRQLREKIPFYDIRHTVKPGLTGWAQINYPYGASVEDAIQKLQYELYYIRNYSVFLDARIVAKTVQVILFARGR